ncbi:MAG: DUF2201 family putative metallopeptidase [Pseudomonadota bacterium]
MKMSEAMLNLLLKQPFYGYVAASVTPAESDDVEKIKMINDAALKLLYSKTWFESLKPEYAMGVLIHELLHIILLHSYRREGRNPLLWEVACDMAVNEQISPELLMKDAITVKNISAEIREKLPPQKSAEFYYDVIAKAEGEFSFFELKDDIHVVLKSGLELTANRQMEDEASEINKSALKSALSDMIEQAQLEGEIPGGINPIISEIYRTTDVNWRNVLRRFLTGKGRITKRKSFKRESRRFENLPGDKRILGLDALVALDASGSISDKQLALFHGELIKIKRLTGANLLVTQFDTDYTPPVAIERYVKEKARSKNGGTDYRPVFELADKLDMSLLIIFTDGEGTAPAEPNQRVVWLLPKGGRKPAEYGHYVEYEM